MVENCTVIMLLPSEAAWSSSTATLMFSVAGSVLVGDTWIAEDEDRNIPEDEAIAGMAMGSTHELAMKLNSPSRSRKVYLEYADRILSPFLTRGESQSSKQIYRVSG
jgi:hypothetical protein